MKKYVVSFVLFILLIPTIVLAEVKKDADIESELKSKRIKLENYGVNKKWDMTDDEKISHALDTPYVDASQKIYDFSNILTDEEKVELKTLMDTFVEKTNMDIVFVSTDLYYYSDSKNEDYAADFYDYNDFGLNFSHYSGVLLLRNTYEADPYFNIYTFGEAQLYFTYERLENILDEIYPDFKGGINYYNGIKTYVNMLSDYYDRGIPYDYRKNTIDENGNVIKGFYPPYILAFILSMITTIIVVYVEVKKNKMIKKSIRANDYLNRDTIKYTKKEDIYLRSHTSSYVVSSNSSSSGGGSHIGSSGGGHSSGGGRHG